MVGTRQCGREGKEGEWGEKQVQRKSRERRKVS